MYFPNSRLMLIKLNELIGNAFWLSILCYKFELVYFQILKEERINLQPAANYKNLKVSPFDITFCCFYLEIVMQLSFSYFQTDYTPVYWLYYTERYCYI